MTTVLEIVGRKDDIKIQSITVKGGSCQFEISKSVNGGKGPKEYEKVKKISALQAELMGGFEKQSDHVMATACSPDTAMLFKLVCSNAGLAKFKAGIVVPDKMDVSLYARIGDKIGDGIQWRSGYDGKGITWPVQGPGRRVDTFRTSATSPNITVTPGEQILGLFCGPFTVRRSYFKLNTTILVQWVEMDKASEADCMFKGLKLPEEEGGDSSSHHHRALIRAPPLPPLSSERSRLASPVAPSMGVVTRDLVKSTGENILDTLQRQARHHRAVAPKRFTYQFVRKDFLTDEGFIYAWTQYFGGEVIEANKISIKDYRGIHKCIIYDPKNIYAPEPEKPIVCEDESCPTKADTKPFQNIIPPKEEKKDKPETPETPQKDAAKPAAAPPAPEPQQEEGEEPSPPKLNTQDPSAPKPKPAPQPTPRPRPPADTTKTTPIVPPEQVPSDQTECDCDECEEGESTAEDVQCEEEEQAVNVTAKPTVSAYGMVDENGDPVQPPTAKPTKLPTLAPTMSEEVEEKQENVTVSEPTPCPESEPCKEKASFPTPKPSYPGALKPPPHRSMVDPPPKRKRAMKMPKNLLFNPHLDEYYVGAELPTAPEQKEDANTEDEELRKSKYSDLASKLDGLLDVLKDPKEDEVDDRTSYNPCPLPNDDNCGL